MGMSLDDWLSGNQLFGDLSDSTKNGMTRGGGGLQLDVVNPTTDAQAAAAGNLDPAGAIHPKTSPVGVLGLIVLGVLVLNYLEHR